ncbi:hypothetical protein ACIGO8_11265 [Streptomyces sp. NPDC053493]|uniref:hypothetical protein n=1 Tax=Streptomyces sp. NPDC053493 TaxID=3365705 RepID=UPI0037CF89F7
MSRHQHTPGTSEKHPETVLGEVLDEVEDAETGARHDKGKDADGGEPATDALSPSVSAQEDARRRAGGEKEPRD